MSAAPGIDELRQASARLGEIAAALADPATGDAAASAAVVPASAASRAASLASSTAAAERAESS